jgi:hypothetical protein
MNGGVLGTGLHRRQSEEDLTLFHGFAVVHINCANDASFEMLNDSKARIRADVSLCDSRAGKRRAARPEQKTSE